MITTLLEREAKSLKILLILLLIPLFGSTMYAQQKFKVVLDAGHGGTDPGNLGNGYYEKNIVLKIVQEVGKILEKEKDIEVIYTRKDDTFIELHERGKIAQKSKADLFVSVHCDAFGKSEVHGASTFVLGLRGNDGNFRIAQKENSVILLEDNYKENYEGFDPNSPESVIGLTLMQEEYLDQSLAIASLIQQNMVNDTKRKDRLVKQDNFLVLRNTFMPSVLVETGFLTNKTEGAYLNSEKGQKEMAKAIYDAIITYKKQIDKNTVVDIPPPVEKPKKTEPEKRIIKGVDFKVQIASSSKKLNTEPYNFKGLRGVERLKIGAHYKYFYGKTSDYNEAKKLQQEARNKGFDSAFVVAFKGEEKISVSDALKL
ncbi:MAG: N-acetylmuramoyl-L-alanine amidase [Flavobacteriaceae bacterium]